MEVKQGTTILIIYKYCKNTQFQLFALMSSDREVNDQKDTIRRCSNQDTKINGKKEVSPFFVSFGSAPLLQRARLSSNLQIMEDKSHHSKLIYERGRSFINSIDLNDSTS